MKPNTSAKRAVLLDTAVGFFFLRNTKPLPDVVNNHYIANKRQPRHQNNPFWAGVLTRQAARSKTNKTIRNPGDGFSVITGRFRLELISGYYR